MREIRSFSFQPSSQARFGSGQQAVMAAPEASQTAASGSGVNVHPLIGSWRTLTSQGSFREKVEAIFRGIELRMAFEENSLPQLVAVWSQQLQEPGMQKSPALFEAMGNTVATLQALLRGPDYEGLLSLYQGITRILKLSENSVAYRAAFVSIARGLQARADRAGA